MHNIKLYFLITGIEKKPSTCECSVYLNCNRVKYKDILFLEKNNMQE